MGAACSRSAMPYPLASASAPFWTTPTAHPGDDGSAYGAKIESTQRETESVNVFCAPACPEASAIASPTQPTADGTLILKPLNCAPCCPAWWRGSGRLGVSF